MRNRVPPPISAAFVYNLTYTNWQFGDNLVPRVSPQTGYSRYVGRGTSSVKANLRWFNQRRTCFTSLSIVSRRRPRYFSHSRRTPRSAPFSYGIIDVDRVIARRCRYLLGRVVVIFVAPRASVNDGRATSTNGSICALSFCFRVAAD